MGPFFSGERALTVESAAIAQVGGRAALVPLQLSGHEAINGLFEYRLVLQTPDALLELGADVQGANFQLCDMLGREISCRIELEGHGHFVAGQMGHSGAANQGAGVREINALITDARLLGEDSRHALYELTLRPWLHLATLSADCKVFQDQTPVQVIRSVLADYPFASEMRLIETYPVRDYIVQYNETDHQFICRLMQEWGINHHFEHAAGVHRLIVSDHNGAFTALQKDAADSAYHRIAYHRPGHKIDEEYIHAFTPTQRLTAGAYESREYDPTRPKAQLKASASGQRPTGQNAQDVYLWRGGQTIGQAAGQSPLAASDWSQENAGADKAAHQTEPQGQHLARLRMQALRQGGHRAHGQAHCRGIAAGHSFTLRQHPQEAANTEYITLSARLLIENVSEDTARTTGGKSGADPDFLPKALSDAQRLSGQWRCTVAFEVQPSTELLRPQAHQPKPHIPGPETALVCGPEGESAESNLYTDHLGRIKVQFPWDRYGPRNHTSSCWVRVANAWAGNQLGAMHIPRVGQEVVISFIGGDIDRPLCTGRVYNQDNLPPWKLPEQQALSGMRSRELKPGGGNSAAGRSNHLLLDDTDQGIQVQLKSDHQHSSLSLGHITRIEDHAGRKDHRGEGFELRTDGHGAVRAKDGLILTTEARDKASEHTTSLGETCQRLQQAQGQHEGLGQLAAQHQAQEAGDQDQVAQALQAQNQGIEGRLGADPNTPQPKAAGARKFPELSEPHLVLASPAGIESTTPQSTHQHSAQHHAITSGGHTSVSSGKSFLASAKEAIRLFAYKRGMRFTSVQDNIDLHALSTNMGLLAKLDITFKANRIDISAKENVLINGGGSYTRWAAQGIESGTTGSWVSHAATHSMDGPRNAPLQVKVPPVAPLQEELWLSLYTQPSVNQGHRLAAEPYQLLKNGAVIDEGVSDEWGRVRVKNHTPGTLGYQVRMASGLLVNIPVSDQLQASSVASNQGHRHTPT